MYLSTGTGGTIGCIFGGLMTQNYHPKWCFLAYSFMGIIVTGFALFLTKESERDSTEADEEIRQSEGDISTSLEDYESEQRRELEAMGVPREQAQARNIPKRDGFCYNLKKNLQAIGRAILRREIYFLVIFFILKGILNPSFREFTYFFLLNEIHISKFTFAMLELLGSICNVLGAIIYKSFLRSIDTRTIILVAFISGSVSSFLNFTFAKRWNLEMGIPDIAFLLFTDIVFDTFVTMLYTLPILALFAKITPRNIEGTIFATLTGIMNFASTIISPGVGSFINH